MAEQVIRIEGLNEFRRELKNIDSDLPKELRRGHKKVGDFAADRVRPFAPGRTKAAIKGRGTQREATLKVGHNPPYSVAKMVGANRRFGWYGKARYRSSAGRQFQPHLGASWTPGQLYYIGPPLMASLDDIVEIWGEMLDDLTKKAYPD